MDDLVAFLRARYAEAEQRTQSSVLVAVEDLRTALTPGVDAEETVAAMRRLLATLDGAEQDTARMLADIAAKRRLVDTAHRSIYAPEEENSAEVALAEDVLKLLAFPFADHHDYQERWKP